MNVNQARQLVAIRMGPALATPSVIVLALGLSWVGNALGHAVRARRTMAARR